MDLNYLMQSQGL